MLLKSTLFQDIISASSPDFTLKSLPDFPFSEYSELQTKYAECEEWFSGEALAETQEQASKDVELYPLHLNPIRSAVLKHAYALWGEYPDDAAGTLVGFSSIIREDTDKEIGKKIEQALTDVWYDNRGAALQMEQSTLSQIYGGCIFKISWVPEGNPQIRIERVHPREFVGVPSSTNFWSLKKAWLIREISSETAEEYGVRISGTKGWYIEYWTQDEYQILINDSPITLNIAGNLMVAGGDNPFGFVPFVYIPHERSGKFYGTPLISESAIGITKELNLRAADAGDAASDQSHSVLAMRNVRGTPQIIRLSNGMPVVQLGSNQTIGGQAEDPDLFSVNRSTLSKPMLDLVTELRNEFRREVMVPAVAEGEDEGSQRSAATLQARMWPLTSHIKSERAYWTTGLIDISTMILKIMTIKGLMENTILGIKIKPKWFPILPRDRQAFIEELVARAGVKIGSLENLMELAGDIEDIDLSMQQIKDFMQFEADTAPKPTFGGPDVGRQKKSSGASDGSKSDS